MSTQANIAGMFLTPEEVFQITERKYPKCQRKVLRNKEIPFDLSASGRPLVLRAVYERRHQVEPEASNEPNLQSIIRRYKKTG